MNATDTQQQAAGEDAQACLGNALVYLKLIDLRMRMAALQQPALLEPAIDDGIHARELIRRAQAAIRAMLPAVVRRG